MTDDAYIDIDSGDDVDDTVEDDGVNPNLNGLGVSGADVSLALETVLRMQFGGLASGLFRRAQRNRTLELRNAARESRRQQRDAERIQRIQDRNNRSMVRSTVRLLTSVFRNRRFGVGEYQAMITALLGLNQYFGYTVEYTLGAAVNPIAYGTPLAYLLYNILREVGGYIKYTWYRKQYEIMYRSTYLGFAWDLGRSFVSAILPAFITGTGEYNDIMTRHTARHALACRYALFGYDDRYNLDGEYVLPVAGIRRVVFSMSSRVGYQEERRIANPEPYVPLVYLARKVERIGISYLSRSGRQFYRGFLTSEQYSQMLFIEALGYRRTPSEATYLAALRRVYYCDRTRDALVGALLDLDRTPNPYDDNTPSMAAGPFSSWLAVATNVVAFLATDKVLMSGSTRNSVANLGANTGQSVFAPPANLTGNGTFDGVLQPSTDWLNDTSQVDTDLGDMFNDDPEPVTILQPGNLTIQSPGPFPVYSTSISTPEVFNAGVRAAADKAKVSMAEYIRDLNRLRANQTLGEEVNNDDIVTTFNKLKAGFEEWRADYMNRIGELRYVQTGMSRQIQVNRDLLDQYRRTVNETRILIANIDSATDASVWIEKARAETTNLVNYMMTEEFRAAVSNGVYDVMQKVAEITSDMVDAFDEAKEQSKRAGYLNKINKLIEEIQSDKFNAQLEESVRKTLEDVSAYSIEFVRLVGEKMTPPVLPPSRGPLAAARSNVTAKVPPPPRRGGLSAAPITAPEVAADAADLMRERLLDTLRRLPSVPQNDTSSLNSADVIPGPLPTDESRPRPLSTIEEADTDTEATAEAEAEAAAAADTVTEEQPIPKPGASLPDAVVISPESQPVPEPPPLPTEEEEKVAIEPPADEFEVPDEFLESKEELNQALRCIADACKGLESLITVEVKSLGEQIDSARNATLTGEKFNTLMREIQQWPILDVRGYIQHEFENNVPRNLGEAYRYVFPPTIDANKIIQTANLDPNTITMIDSVVAAGGIITDVETTATRIAFSNKIFRDVPINAIKQAPTLLTGATTPYDLRQLGFELNQTMQTPGVESAAFAFRTACNNRTRDFISDPTNTLLLPKIKTILGNLRNVTIEDAIKANKDKLSGEVPNELMDAVLNTITDIESDVIKEWNELLDSLLKEILKKTDSAISPTIKVALRQSIDSIKGANHDVKNVPPNISNGVLFRRWLQNNIGILGTVAIGSRFLIPWLRHLWGRRYADEDIPFLTGGDPGDVGFNQKKARYLYTLFDQFGRLFEMMQGVTGSMLTDDLTLDIITGIQRPSAANVMFRMHQKLHAIRFYAGIKSYDPYRKHFYLLYQQGRKDEVFPGKRYVEQVMGPVRGSIDTHRPELQMACAGLADGLLSDIRKYQPDSGFGCIEPLFRRIFQAFSYMSVDRVNSPGSGGNLPHYWFRALHPIVGLKSTPYHWTVNMDGLVNEHGREYECQYSDDLEDMLEDLNLKNEYERCLYPRHNSLGQESYVYTLRKRRGDGVGGKSNVHRIIELLIELSIGYRRKYVTALATTAELAQFAMMRMTPAELAAKKIDYDSPDSCKLQFQRLRELVREIGRGRPVIHLHDHRGEFMRMLAGAHEHITNIVKNYLAGITDGHLAAAAGGGGGMAVSAYMPRKIIHTYIAPTDFVREVNTLEGSYNRARVSLQNVPVDITPCCLPDCSPAVLADTIRFHTSKLAAPQQYYGIRLCASHASVMRRELASEFSFFAVRISPGTFIHYYRKD
jgi:hypothetical protein